MSVVLSAWLCTQSTGICREGSPWTGGGKGWGRALLMYGQDTQHRAISDLQD